MALNYNALTTLTKKKYIPRLVDAVFNSTPLLAWLKDRQETFDGGYKIVEPLIYDELSGIKSYSYYDTMEYDTSIPITAAEFEPKNVAGTCIISKDEELKNMGENQVLKLLDAKMRIVEESMKKNMTTQLLSDGTGNSSKDVTGIAALFSKTNIYGGIDRNTYSWWHPQINDNSGTPQTLTEKLMLDAFLSATDGSDKPDMILTGLNGYKQYYLLVKSRITLYSEGVKKAMNLGFQTLEFQGIPVMYDLSITDSSEVKFYFINSKYLTLRAHKAANFTPTKWRPDNDRLAMKQEILWTGNLTCSNCRRQATLEDINPIGITS